MMDERMDKWMDCLTVEWIDGHMNRSMDGQTDSWVGRLMDRWIVIGHKSRLRVVIGSL